MEEVIEEQKGCEIEAVKHISRIDYQVKMTRKRLGLDNLSGMIPHSEDPNKYSAVELGFGIPVGFIMMRYLYLISKLVVLYVVKGSRWAMQFGKSR